MVNVLIDFRPFLEDLNPKYDLKTAQTCTSIVALLFAAAGEGHYFLKANNAACASSANLPRAPLPVL